MNISLKRMSFFTRKLGIDLGTAGNAYVDTILEVKEKYPKPE